MNKLLLTSALVAAFGAAALAPQVARASDGTITINGSVVASVEFHPKLSHFTG